MPLLFSLPSRLVLILALFKSFELVLADTNVTVDDNDSSIQYSDGWSVSTGFNSLDYGGFHHLSDSNTSTANFTFTGTAVYIMAPLWPYAVGIQAGVDSTSPVGVPMQDFTHTTNGGSEDITSAVVWGVSNLSNTSHTLYISFWNIEEFMALDAIIYTVANSTTSSSASSTASSASSSSTSASDSTSKPKSKSHTAVIAGAAVGGLALAFIVMSIAICITRRRRNSNDQKNLMSGAGGAAAFVGGAGGTVGSSRTFEGKSYPGAPPLGSPDSFGNSPNQNPNTMSYYSTTNSFSTAGAAGVGAGLGAGGAHQYANAAPHMNTMSSFSEQGQPGAQYGPDQRYQSYNPWDHSSAMASVAAAAAAGGAYTSSNSDVGDRKSSYQAPPAGTGPAVGTNSFSAPGQIVLSYGGSNVAPSETAGSSTSRSDVYTTKASDASEEKRRLALAYREEEEQEEAPPTYED